MPEPSAGRGSRALVRTDVGGLFHRVANEHEGVDLELCRLRDRMGRDPFDLRLSRRALDLRSSFSRGDRRSTPSLTPGIRFRPGNRRVEDRDRQSRRPPGTCRPSENSPPCPTFAFGSRSTSKAKISLPRGVRACSVFTLLRNSARSPVSQLARSDVRHFPSPHTLLISAVLPVLLMLQILALACFSGPGPKFCFSPVSLFCISLKNYIYV